MTRSTKLLVAGITLLLVANFWHWQASGSGATAAPAGKAPTTVRAEDFRLLAGAPRVQQADAMRRDPFQLRRASVAAVPVRVRSPAPAVVATAPVAAPIVPEPPQKSPEQLAEEAARAELGKYKLVGIVVRGSGGEAFLVRNEQLFFAHRGDTLDGRFAVDSVHADRVVLRDPATKVQGTIHVAGK